MKPLLLTLAAVAILLAVPASTLAEPTPLSTTVGLPLALRYRAIPERPPLRLLTSSTPLSFSVVAGESMEPLLLAGELLVVVPMSHVVAVRVGEVVIYDSSACPLYQRGLVAHRVIRQTTLEGRTVYVLKGDANPIADPCPVTWEMLKGVVLGVLWATVDQ